MKRLKTGQCAGVGAGIALALVLSGCAGDGSASTGGGTPAPGGETAPAGEIDAQAVLRAGSQYGPENLDPIDGQSAGYLPFLIPVYDRLLTIDAEFNLGPMLATEWEYTEGGRALDLQLRDDVDFHDGAHFDAAAVKANIERAIADGGPNVQTQLASVDSVEVLGDHEVRFNLKEGQGAELLYNLSSFAGFMVSPDALALDSLDYEPVGSGPYQLKEGTFRQSERVTYERVGDYWGGGDDERPAELVLSAYTDINALHNALQSGQLDVIMTEPTDRLPAFESDPNFQTILQPGGYYYIQLNLEWEGLDDIRVRQAIAHAIDKEALNEGVLQGTCAPTGQPLVSFMDGYDEALNDLYPYDPERSRELLAEAGFADGLELPGIFASSVPYDGIATAVQSMLADVGVTADFTTSSIPELQVMWREGEAALHTPGATFRGDTSQQLLTFRSPATVPGGTPEEVEDALTPLTDPNLSEEERSQAHHEANAAIAETLPSVLLCHRQKVVIADDSIAGIDNMPTVMLGAYDVQHLTVRKP